MTSPALYVDGKPLQLGKRIGKGGEGEVYAIANDPKRAVKFYTARDGTTREKKIEAIVRLRLAEQSSLVAFPTALARDRHGRFAGFVMPLMRDFQPLHELYAPGPRKRNFPKASYRFLVRSALNAARAVAAVHDVGCVIGDINHSGILIAQDATAALIDADSFQVSDGKARYLCVVGSLEYTPPELQGRSLSGIVRTSHHDAFGLAVVVFLLLTMGKHPFIGTYEKGDLPLETAISGYRFAFSSRRSVGMSPPPGACTLKDFPQPVADAFETAFSPEHTTSRPTAKQWVALLTDLEAQLTTCPANSQHHYFNGAPGCPWCRMEGQTGIVLFLPNYPSGSLPPQFQSIVASLAPIWAQVDAIALPSRDQIRPFLYPLAPNPSTRAKDVARSNFAPGFMRVAGIALAIALFIAFPPAWWIAIGLAIAGFVLANNHEASSRAPFRQDIYSVDQDWKRALEQWEQRLALDRLDHLKHILGQAKRAADQLPSHETQCIAKYERDRHSHQKREHLEKYRIRNFKIKGVGPAKLAALSSYGIDTAADFTRTSLLAVPGFGPTNSRPLLDWQHDCAKSFVYNSQPTPSDQVEIAKIRSEISLFAQRLHTQVTRDAQDYLRLAQATKLLISSPDPELNRLHQRRSQLETDCRHLGIAVASLPSFTLKRAGPTPSTPAHYTLVTPASAQTQPQARGPLCPTCQSPMVRRTARRGRRTRSSFWGCSSRPLKNSEATVAETPETRSVIELRKDCRDGSRSDRPQMPPFWGRKTFFSGLLGTPPVRAGDLFNFNSESFERRCHSGTTKALPRLHVGP